MTRFGNLLDFGNFSKPLVTINLPKSLTLLGNFCKDAKIFNFFEWNHFWATFVDIWLFFTGHTALKPRWPWRVLGKMLLRFRQSECTLCIMQSSVWKPNSYLRHLQFVSSSLYHTDCKSMFYYCFKVAFTQLRISQCKW